MRDQLAAQDSTRTVLRRGLDLIGRHVRLHPLPFAVSVFGAVLFAGFTVMATVVLGRVTDDVVVPAFAGSAEGGGFGGTVSNKTLAWAVAAVVAVTLLRVVGVVLRRYFAGMTGERVQRSLRYRLADQYLGLPMEWHQSNPTGKLLAHADSDTEVSTELLHPLPFSVGVAFLALFAAISLILVDPFLAGVGLLIFPALMALNSIYSRRIEVPAAEIQESVGRVSTIAHESFDGALVVKTLGRESAEVERFTVAAEELRKRRVKVGFLRAMFEPSLDAIPNLGIIVVVIVGISRVQSGAVRPGELVQVAALFSVLAFPMRVLGYFLESMPPSVVATERLTSVFSSQRLPGPATPLPLASGPLSLDVVELSFTYPGSADAEPALSAVVLDDISFSVRPGEVVAIVGPTAAGKSTMASLIVGLLRPDRGSVLVSGIPIEQVAAADRTSAIGLVFQESFLFSGSLRDNIDLERDHSDEAVAEAVEISQLTDLVADLDAGLGTEVGERGVTLSGGQRQRVALARALLRKPRLLVLDDATSAVDARVEQQILGGLRRSLDMTTLIVAQRMSTITLADRVVYISEGKVAGVGTHAELMTLDSYVALVTAYEEAAAK